jgi:hypothetical protein
MRRLCVLYIVTQNESVTATGSRGVFGGKGVGSDYGRQATIRELGYLVQLPGQAL